MKDRSKKKKEMKSILGEMEIIDNQRFSLKHVARIQWIVDNLDGYKDTKSKREE